MKSHCTFGFALSLAGVKVGFGGRWNPNFCAVGHHGEMTDFEKSRVIICLMNFNRFVFFVDGP